MKSHLLHFLIVVLALVACTSTPVTIPAALPSPTATSRSSSVRSDGGLHLLIVARGQVTLKREDWPGYQPTAFGAVLRRGDLLQLGPDAQATVLCSNLVAIPVPPGAPWTALGGCTPVPEAPLVRPEGLLGPTRGAIDPMIPYVISPRATRLLSDQPNLRWHGVTGVTTYTVAIRGDDGTRWETSTTATRMAYPSDAPRLKSGTNYLLQVHADSGRSSTEEGTPGLGFRTLVPEEAEPIRRDTARLEALALPAEAESYALAHLYAGQDLFAEAIELLEALAAGDSQEPAVYRTLGDWYRLVELERLAESRYLEAVRLSEKVGDAEGWAIAHASLAELYVGWGNKDEAMRHWDQSLQKYEVIGDQARIEGLQSRIAEIK